MSEDKLTILAVGGHIGDMELTAGMALAKHSLEGAHIVTLALTAGERARLRAGISRITGSRR
jgi:hypothetical protein